MQRNSGISRALVATAVVLGMSATAARSMAGDTEQRGPAAQETTPAATKATAVTVTATVDRIDKPNRKVTLKDAQGKTRDVKVGPDVNIDRLRVGDAVNATYYEEVAVAIRKHAEGAPKTATRSVVRDGVTAQQATVTAPIVSVDRDKNMITVQDPGGKQHMLKVEDPDLRTQLGKIHPGDKMDITYTQAVAVSIEPRK
jgi:hypothetical protein